MFTSVLNSSRATCRFLYNNQFRTVLIYSGAVVTGFAVLDYTRAIDNDSCRDFHEKPSGHLAESLEQLHSAAFDRDIRYVDILMNQNRSIELYYLSAIVEKHFLEYRNSPKLKDVGAAEIASMVERKNYNFALRMCRRSMIRNGHLVKWFKAMLADEFIKYYVIPVLSFFVTRHLKNNV